jgi:type IV pilus assembly protein PilM
MSKTGPTAGLLASAPVPAAVEITARRLTAVSLAADRSITAHASELLPDGLVTPALNATNIHDPNALSAALKSVLDRLSPRPRRIALIVPDTVAKVSLLRFEKTPPRLQDLEQLIRWQMRKTVPFRVEDAQVGWTEGRQPQGGAGHEYLVVVARRDIVESYERACDGAGAHAGVVDIASLNLVNAALAIQAGDASDWLLIHLAPGYATLVVVRNGEVISFRNRSFEGAATAADLDDLVHQTAMYHEDRLGGGPFGRVVLAGVTTQGDKALDLTRRAVEERLGVRVELLDVRAGVTLRDRITASTELVDAIAPAVGILLRERPHAPKQTTASGATR